MASPQHQDDDMVRTIGEVRTLMAKNDHMSALSKAFQATRLCPCGQRAMHPRDKSCHIYQCILAVISSRPDEIRCKECPCGFIWPSCDRPSHIEAVDLLAECSAKADRYAAAFSIALGLIRLDPASAAGYCRLVMIMRHLVKAQLDVKGPETRSLMVLVRDTQLGSVNAFAEFIRPVIQCGLANTPYRRHAQDIKYRAILQKMAHHLGMPEAKANPVAKLPPEVLNMIFSYLDISSLLRCMRVNKEWKRLLLSDDMLWREIRIKKPGNPKQHLVEFIKARRSIRVLVFEEIADFSLTAAKAQVLLGGLPWLRRLQLGTTMKRPERFKDGLGGLSGQHLTFLTHLRLWGVGFPLMLDLTQLASSTLESLDLRDADFSGLPTRFPNLKRLRMKAVPHRLCIDLGFLAYQTPALQHLYLDGCRIPTLSFSDNFGVWNDLRSLVIGEVTTTSPPLSTLPPSAAGLSPVTTPLFSANIESIEILTRDPWFPFALVFPVRSGCGLRYYHRLPPPVPSPATTEDQSYPHLRVFRCRTPISPPLLEWTLAPSLANATLSVLDLSHSPSRAHFHPPDDLLLVEATLGAPSPDPNDEYPFLTAPATSSVRKLGFWDFNFAPRGDPTGFGFAPVLAFLARFPGVDEVAVFPGARNVWVLVMELIETGRVKRVEQDRLTGVEWTSMQELAGRKGVEVVHLLRGLKVEWDSEGW